MLSTNIMADALRRFHRARDYGIALSVLPLVSASAAAQVHWQPHWQKVQPVEYGVTLGLAATTLAVSLAVKPRTGSWRGGVLFDGAVRNELRASTRSGRDRARLVGDVGYQGLLYFPWIDVLMSWAIHGDDEVAWQMLAIDAEAIAFAGFVAVMTDHLVGRARPSVAQCARDPEYERFCGEADAYGSFLSGHTLIAAAGAGATCAHHSSMPFYGGAGDIAVCAAASVLALTTGVARIINDRHWATDVTLALLIGAGVGYLWPRYVHYRDRERASTIRFTIMPAAGPGWVAGTIWGSL